MGTASDALNTLRGVEASFDRDLEAIVKALSPTIIDLLRVDQLLKKGIGPSGIVIGIYSKATGNISSGKSGPGFPKIPGTPYNFLDDGEMWSSYELSVGKDVLRIINTSMSLDLFLNRTGLDETDVVGFTDENSTKINYELILPKLRELFRNKFQ